MLSFECRYLMKTSLLYRFAENRIAEKTCLVSCVILLYSRSWDGLPRWNKNASRKKCVINWCRKIVAQLKDMQPVLFHSFDLCIKYTLSVDWHFVKTRSVEFIFLDRDPICWKENSRRVKWRLWRITDGSDGSCERNKSPLQISSKRVVLCWFSV